MCDPGIYTDVCFFSGPAPIDGSERQKDSVWTGGVRRKIRCLAILDRQLRQSRLVLEDAGMVAHTYAVHTQNISLFTCLVAAKSGWLQDFECMLGPPVLQGRLMQHGVQKRCKDDAR